MVIYCSCATYSRHILKLPIHHPSILSSSPHFLLPARSSFCLVMYTPASFDFFLMVMGRGTCAFNPCQRLVVAINEALPVVSFGVALETLRVADASRCPRPIAHAHRVTHARMNESCTFSYTRRQKTELGSVDALLMVD